MALFPDSYTSEEDLTRFLSSPIPVAFDTMTADDDIGSGPVQLVHDLKSKPFRDSVTECDYGGAGGIRWFLLLCMKMDDHWRKAEATAKAKRRKARSGGEAEGAATERSNAENEPPDTQFDVSALKLADDHGDSEMRIDWVSLRSYTRQCRRLLDAHLDHSLTLLEATQAHRERSALIPGFSWTPLPGVADASRALPIPAVAAEASVTDHETESVIELETPDQVMRARSDDEDAEDEASVQKAVC